MDTAPETQLQKALFSYFDRSHHVHSQKVHRNFGNKFRRVAPIQIFGSFFTFSWNIDQFYCFWAWFDVKFYVELKMGSKVQLEAFGAQKRNLLVMNFLVVWPIHRSEIVCWAQKSILYGVWNATGSYEGPKTWNSIKSCQKNLIFSVKQITFSMELEVFFTIIKQTYSKLVISFMNRKSSCGYATHLYLCFFHFWYNFAGLQESTYKIVNRKSSCGYATHFVFFSFKS
jgi:hypothetical protein